MRTYRFGPLQISTRMRLAELEPVTPAGGGRHWRFDLSAAAPAFGRHVRWFHRWTFPDGRPWALIGTWRGEYVIRFARTASFRVNPDARRIVGYRCRWVPAATVRHLLLDQILPLVVAEGPHLVLHASAVEHHGAAVAFFGPSGSGKSTIAAVLARHGSTVMTDDCLVVDVARDRPRVIPTYAGLRLWPDALHTFFPQAPCGAFVAHYTRKRRFAASAGVNGSRSVPLRAVCAIVRPGRRAPLRPRVTRLRGHEAFAAVLGCSFHLDTVGRGPALALGRVASLLAAVPAYRLDLPAGLMKLQTMPQVVTDLISG